jgi:ABC-type transporter MlaC component
MAKELTERQKRIRVKARKAAKAAGKDWKTASKEERRAFMAQARTNPHIERAKQAATAAGKNWKELSLEERKNYVKAARGKA